MTKSSAEVADFIELHPVKNVVFVAKRKLLCLDSVVNQFGVLFTGSFKRSKAFYYVRTPF
jgi:hypothetical protein